MMTSSSGSACGCSASPAELGNVRAACRIFGIHPSTYYRWRGPVLRIGPRDAPAAGAAATADAQPDEPAHRAAGPRLRLGHPGLGPRRISATLAQERWGGIVISPNGVWRVLRRHGLTRRISRLSLVAGYAAPPEPERPTPLEPRHVEVDHPGELVGFDCFHVGRLAGTTGRVWQYTAIDLATLVRLGRAAHDAAQPVGAADAPPGPAGGGRPGAPRLAARAGPHRQRLASSARRVFGDTLRELGATQTFIRAGPTDDQRRRRAGPAHHPRGVLAADQWSPDRRSRPPIAAPPCRGVATTDGICQYTSLAFGRRLRESGIAASMGSVGDCYDNAMAESFFATLETELIDRSDWASPAEARAAVFEYIEVFYNRIRRHSSLGNLSPEQFEERYRSAPAVAAG